MGINLSLSHTAIDKLITAEERALRSADHPPEVVEAVFRYGAFIGGTILAFPTLQRGMEYARQLIQEHEKSGRSFAGGTVISAAELTGGRGRFQRYWHAPSGGIWLTLVLVNTLLPESSRLLPLAAGVACCETIQHYVPEAKLKWVNDVHVNGKKICGILAETLIGKESGEEYILIGIGINANNTVFPPEIAGQACSIKSVSGVDVDITQLAVRLLAKLTWNMGLLYYLEARQLQEFGYEEMDAAHGKLLLHRWRQLSDTIGRRVVFGFDVQQQPQFEAEVLDVDDEGGLHLRNLQDNTHIVEHSGEILYLD